jgi:hypothetical protein
MVRSWQVKLGQQFSHLPRASQRACIAFPGANESSYFRFKILSDYLRKSVKGRLESRFRKRVNNKAKGIAWGCLLCLLALNEYGVEDMIGNVGAPIIFS